MIKIRAYSEYESVLSRLFFETLKIGINWNKNSGAVFGEFVTEIRNNLPISFTVSFS
jgi:hypothetical protein